MSEKSAARSKKVDADVLPLRTPMKGSQKIRRAPSTDQKRQRREQARSTKTATQFTQQADSLQPGDQIRTPTGQSVKVRKTRNHETSMDHIYVETDAGTTVVRRDAPFTVMPVNSTQQEVPGFGIPGANTNEQPFSGSPGATNQAPTQGQAGACPNCGAQGTLHRQGNHYVCSRCGFQQNLGPLGTNPLLDSNQVLRNFRSSKTPTSAIARRAAQVLTDEETS
jgi:preprotein translocase subunit YajC/predicted RNA-binding Zn-ribbon protein involved in translation (DUF1610 family)